MTGRTCEKCGNAVTYRNKNGHRIPYHFDGRCIAREPRIYPGEAFCRRWQCPECRNYVYFVKHNGGSVYFDELGWPWPKHSHDRPDSSRSFEKHIDHTFRLGVIERMMVHDWSATLAIVELDNARACIQIEHASAVEDLLGQLVSFTSKRLIDMRGRDWAVILPQALPADVELPDNWCKGQSPKDRRSKATLDEFEWELVTELKSRPTTDFVELRYRAADFGKSLRYEHLVRQEVERTSLAIIKQLSKTRHRNA